MTSRRRRSMSALVAVTALLAACGGSDDTSSDESIPETSDQLAEAEAPTDDEPDDVADDSATSDPVDDEQGGGDEADDETPTTDAPAPTTLPEAPPVFEGEDVLVVGSNAWPIVGDLLALGVTPVAIYSQLGNQEQPDYLTEAYGDQLADVPITYTNLFELDPEELIQIDADRVVLPDFFEAVLAGDEIWQRVLTDDVVYLPVQNWRGSIGVLADAAGESADPVLAELEAEYDRRLAEIANSLDYDPSEVVFNTFQFNEDGTYLPAFDSLPIVQVMGELGFQLHPSLSATDPTPPQSQETVTDMDADLVFVQVRNVEFDSLASDPLWATTSVAASGNVFERFQYGQQAGWLETVALLDQLEVDLPQYRAS